MCRGIPYNRADGPCSIGVASTNVDYYKGISRSLDDQSSFYLEGVFLTYRKPSRPAPSPLDFSKGALGQDFHSLSPSIGQVFFIGNGVADTGPGAAGYRQAFHVPPGATRLFLGFSDAMDGLGLPGEYDDNTGELAVVVRRS